MHEPAQRLPLVTGDRGAESETRCPRVLLLARGSRGAGHTASLGRAKPEGPQDAPSRASSEAALSSIPRLTLLRLLHFHCLGATVLGAPN